MSFLMGKQNDGVEGMIKFTL
uniref:Uncharacterized protein n=1 Tax=Rhizophora mucronata TaxID=61149 RepID=A0A2P2NR38_RHIMU